MDKVSKIAEVNWSAIACRAFLDHVIEHESRRERTKKMDLAKVVERLRSAGAKGESKSEMHGHAAGTFWAQRTAEPGELRRLDREQGNDDWRIGANVSNAYTEFERIAFLIDPSINGDREAARAFWDFVDEDCVDDVDDPNAFILGFCHGAMEVWDAAKFHIDSGNGRP